MHLINGLYDCHRSRVPVLAIAAQVPSRELGSNYFQETRPDNAVLNGRGDEILELARTNLWR